MHTHSQCQLQLLVLAMRELSLPDDSYGRDLYEQEHEVLFNTATLTFLAVHEILRGPSSSLDISHTEKHDSCIMDTLQKFNDKAGRFVPPPLER